MCVSAPERDPSTNRAQSIEIAHKNASLLGSCSCAYRTPLSLAFYCYVNVVDGIFLVAETHRFEKRSSVKQWPELQDPPSHRFVRKIQAALSEQVFDVRDRRRAAPPFACAHISENDRGTPGRGHIDFPAAFRALKGSGYDGWLTIEAFGRALPPLRRREFGAISSRRRPRFIARDTKSFAAAGTQPERLVPWRRVKANIRTRHRGIVPNVAPRNN
jgi:Xylose isomerase-like TIM barrel